MASSANITIPSDLGVGAAHLFTGAGDKNNIKQILTDTKNAIAALEAGTSLGAGAVAASKISLTGQFQKALVGRATPGNITAAGVTAGQRIVAAVAFLTAGGPPVPYVPGTDFTTPIVAPGLIAQLSAVDLSSYTILFTILPAAA